MISLDLDFYIISLMSFVLLYFSVTDILYRRIPNVLTHSIFFFLVVYRLCFGPMLYFIGLIPAIIFLIMFFINPNWIGAGDIKLLAIIGLCVDFQMMLSVLFWMCLCSSLFILTHRLCKKQHTSKQPLAPFMAFGWMVTLIIL